MIPVPGTIPWKTARPWQIGFGKYRNQKRVAQTILKEIGLENKWVNTRGAKMKKPTYEELEQRIKELESKVRVSRKKEKVLRCTEERYSALYNRNLFCVYVHDFGGDFLDANDAALKMLGYEKEEITSLSFASLIDEAQLPQAIATLEELKKKGRQEKLTQYKLRKKDGSFVWVETEASLIHQKGRPNAIQGIALDITERKRAEETRARLVSILEATTDFVGIADGGGKSIYLNRAGRRMVGLGIHENIDGTDIRTRHPEWAAKIVMEIGIPAAIIDGEWGGETALLSSNGKEIPVSQVILAHKNETDELEFLSTIARDITERKQTEVEREKLIAELKKALADIKILSGFLPICANCKNIRDDEGYWHQVEAYIRDHSDVKFSHGICPECMKKLYPDFMDEKD